MKVGERCTLSIVFDPVDANNKNIKYESSNESVATVISFGDGGVVIEAKSPGGCFIKAVSEEGGYEAECQIVVKELTVYDFIKTNV